jgi:aerobic-type carbon monoxide dehydrogenase small subunit (CoxS/CutS family)
MPVHELSINGRSVRVTGDADMPLLWALRDLLGLLGTKYGCGVGACGACTVLLRGEARRSCLLPLSEAAGAPITTIEGLGAAALHPVQEAWLAEDVAQCGYCQPAAILTTCSLLRAHPRPTDAEIDAAFADFVCRCGTYQRMRRAIARAAAAATGPGRP